MFEVLEEVKEAVLVDLQFYLVKYFNDSDKAIENIDKFNLEKDAITNFVKNNINKKNDNYPQELFELIKNNQELKVVKATIPTGILPPELCSVFYDVRIAKPNDDAVYNNNKWIRENITRGMCFMSVSKGTVDDSCTPFFDLVIHSNRKFVGGVEDEDNDMQRPNNDQAWQDYCLAIPSSADSVVCMEKLNGEAAHFTARYISGELYLIAGSKNVHMLFRTEFDVDLYTDSRYGIACVVARALLTTLLQMDKKQSLLLMQLLAVTRATAVCEVLQSRNQHVVLLDYLGEDAIVHLLMLSAMVERTQEVESLTALPPAAGLVLGRALGMKTANFHKIEPNAVSQKINEIRGMRDTEGFVLYYTIGGRTIGMAKVKSAWYIVLRALREKAYRALVYLEKGRDAKVCIAATKKRFDEIQCWIGFDDEFLSRWMELASSFLTWLLAESSADRLERNDLRPQFPRLWQRFLIHANASDRLPMTIIPSKIGTIKTNETPSCSEYEKPAKRRNKNDDSISRLQSVCQQRDFNLSFTLGSDGPPFECVVMVEGEGVPNDSSSCVTAPSKKKARQEAAHVLLQQLAKADINDEVI